MKLNAVVAAKDLTAKSGGTADPYVIVKWGKKSFKTAVKKKVRNNRKSDQPRQKVLKHWCSNCKLKNGPSTSLHLLTSFLCCVFSLSTLNGEKTSQCASKFRLVSFRESVSSGFLASSGCYRPPSLDSIPNRTSFIRKHEPGITEMILEVWSKAWSDVFLGASLWLSMAFSLPLSV